METVGTETVRNEAEEEPSRSWRFYGSFGCLCLVTFIIALDATVISVVLPTIAEDINATAIEAFWCGTGFLLASTVFQPAFASFSHIFGRQPILLIALTLFTLGCIMGGVARNINVLLVGRVIQGVGAGGILSLTYVITTDLVNLRERGKWFGLTSMAWALGSVLGPMVGGALAEVWWPWIFWINLPFCAIAYVVIPVTLTLKRKEGTFDKKLREFDWAGCLLFVLSLTVFLIPLSWGGVMYDWSSWQTVVPLVLGIAGLILFGLHICVLAPKYIKRDPFIRPTLFSSLSGSTAFATTVIHGIIVWCILYYVPLFYLVAKNFTTVIAGVATVPYTATVAPSAVVVGFLITRTGRYRNLVWFGWSLVALGFGLSMLVRADTPTYEWVLIYLVGGVGLGVLYSAQSFAVQAAASNADLPFAAGMYAFFRSLGQCLGVAIGGVTLQNEFRKRIAADPTYGQFADEWARDAVALVEVVRAMGPELQPEKEVIVNAYVDGLRVVWMVMCVLASAALVAVVLAVKDKSLDWVLETEQGLVDKRKSRLTSELGSDMDLVHAKSPFHR